MATAATRRGLLHPVDMAAVEADFRAGLMSIRTIGTKYGVTEGAVRKWAKSAVDAEGNPSPWQRDLKPEVQARAAEILAQDADKSAAHVLAAVRTPHARTQVVRTARSGTEEAQIIDVASRAVVQVVREQRVRIHAGLRLVNRLVELLGVAAGTRDLLQEFIHQETAGDRDGRRRAFLMRQVSLEAHTAAIRDLALAMQRLMVLERQAYGLAIDENPTPPPERDGEQREDADFTRIREKAAKSIAAQQGAADVESKAVK